MTREGRVERNPTRVPLPSLRVLGLTSGIALDPLKDVRHRETASALDLADWKAYLEVSNFAPGSIDDYERSVARLQLAFPDKTFDQFTDGDLLRVLTTYPARSRHLVKAHWNNWFRWGYKQRRIPGNPVDLLPQIKYKSNRDYDRFSEAEVDALCALPPPDGALFSLMLWSGLRKSEARLMTGKRIDFESRQALVIDGAKGGKQRRVPLIGRTTKALADLFILEGIGPDDYLWYKRPGGGPVKRSAPIANATFDDWWHRQLSAAGIRYRNIHMTRHTAATKWREKGLPMEDLRDILGHESVDTTIGTYAHANLSLIGDKMRGLMDDD